MTSSSFVTRFAPSPTGLLHLGHAFSALTAHEAAIQSGGRFIVRIEDIDFTRCRPEYEAAIYEDLAWLGLNWEQPVRRQSDHLADYRTAADDLLARELLYPCFCTRRDILREIDEAGGAPQGPDGPLYPGTCRELSSDEQQSRVGAGESFAMRLHLDHARNAIQTELIWHDELQGRQISQPEKLGDAVLVRRDIGCSYHLAVVLDDALQGVTLVTRGADLFEATHLHRLLQALLNLPTPRYHHHPLQYDDSGRRLAKRDQSETLRSLRHRGVTPDDLRRQLGLES